MQRPTLASWGIESRDKMFAGVCRVLAQLWQQGWISSKFPLKAVISKRLDGPNILRPQELDFQ